VVRIHSPRPILRRKEAGYVVSSFTRLFSFIAEVP
jgi:hypothetical protein